MDGTEVHESINQVWCCIVNRAKLYLDRISSVLYQFCMIFYNDHEYEVCFVI
jgi:hypothetical protein